MYEPPPGFDDLIGDADGAPTGYVTLEVPGVGEVSARRPLANALANLSMSASPKLTPQSRNDYATLFLQAHLGPGEYARLLHGLMMEEHPPDTVDRVVQAISTMGTARPTSPSSRSRWWRRATGERSGSSS